jgi:hypothetical protein
MLRIPDLGAEEEDEPKPAMAGTMKLRDAGCK